MCLQMIRGKAIWHTWRAVFSLSSLLFCTFDLLQTPNSSPLLRHERLVSGAGTLSRSCQTSENGSMGYSSPVAQVVVVNLITTYVTVLDIK